MRGCRGRRKEPYKKAGGTPKGFFFSPCNKSVIFYNTTFFKVLQQPRFYITLCTSEESGKTAMFFVVFRILEGTVGFDQTGSNKNQQIFLGTGLTA